MEFSILVQNAQQKTGKPVFEDDEQNYKFLDALNTEWRKIRREVRKKLALSIIEAEKIIINT